MYKIRVEFHFQFQIEQNANGNTVKLLVCLLSLHFVSTFRLAHVLYCRLVHNQTIRSINVEMSENEQRCSCKFLLKVCHRDNNAISFINIWVTRFDIVISLLE
jgi:serine acetyltransferase